MKTIFTITGIAKTSVADQPEDKPRDVDVGTGPLGIIVRIADTPGSWYLQTLAADSTRGGNYRVAIDFGQQWVLDNPKEVVASVSRQIAFLLERHVK